MGIKTYLFNRITSKKFRLNGIWPSTRLPNKQKLCKAFRDHVVYTADELPHKVDLRDDMTPVEDQSKIGSCAANCLAGAYEYLTKKSDNRNTDVSRLFIYYNGRAKKGGPNTIKDSGCTMTGAIEALEEFGTCLESTWPYNIHEVNSRPNDRAFQEAKGHTITDALQIDIDLHEMKSCLAQGYPFAFGLQLFKSFDKASTMGIVPMPNASERMRSSHGSHALLAVGYSDQSQSFIVRNSWGSDWGEKGYCYIPYSYMTNSEFCFDAWAVRKLANDNFGKEHWDNIDSINYFKAAAIALLTMDNSNDNEDNCDIENIDEDDEPNKGESNQWSSNPGWDKDNHNCGSTYSQPDFSSGYGQQQPYGGGSNNYHQQPQWGSAGYDQYRPNFPPNHNFPDQFQNQYGGHFQGASVDYGNSSSNSSQYPAYGIDQNYNNTGHQPSLADIMNAPGYGNQQPGMGFGYDNNPYNNPNQYRQ